MPQPLTLTSTNQGSPTSPPIRRSLHSSKYLPPSGIIYYPVMGRRNALRSMFQKKDISVRSAKGLIVPLLKTDKKDDIKSFQY
ncbi:hypothetical protein TNCT_336081 [Trichonephila clavata]|uniref:Uncharacterized protein n=1 Tax=Trichonephila clavata TaxID=2740835 RepID=A0A8X6HCN1_TRICU|nr:hypothetical protein TNCT_336081 [Trichonephila clavata]